jgi:hypothetical protein
MEKIFQILIVFALMIFAITWFIRGRERKYREYSFSGRFTFPLSGDWSRDLISAAEDKENHLFFRRGRDKTLEIVDEANGVLIGAVTLEWDADVLLFDPGSRLIFCGSVEGAVTIIRQVLPDVYKTVQRLAVPKDCTAMSLEPHSGKLYMHFGVSAFVYTNA